MRQATAHPQTAEEQEQPPPDIATMRESAAEALGPDDGLGALAPAADLDTLTVALRGHLALLVPEVERAVGPRPKSVQACCALACIGEARRKMGTTPRSGLEHRVAHARRLARSLVALCEHYELLGGRP